MVVLAVTGCISILSIVAFLLLVKSGGVGGNAKALPLREQEFPALAVFARLSTEFVFMQDALFGFDPEHLRRWSEQIEYSTENVERLLNV